MYNGSAVIYSRLGCPYVNHMKKILAENGISYSESVVGRDIIQEDVSALFPGYVHESVVSINGVKIGGFRELVEWANNRPSFLAG